MIALLIFIVAAASAAPHHSHHGHGPPSPFHRDDFQLHQFFKDDIFDTRSFWDELRRDLLSLDTIVDDFVKHFPASVSSAVVDGNVYRITVRLPGFDESEIAVKGKRGLVMIQAVHKCEGVVEKSYMDMRSLPTWVNETGKWTYDRDVLEVEFPLIGKGEETSTELVTRAPVDREEMEPVNEDADHDADVGVGRGDVDKQTELKTNEIPGGRVEATTYAVDLKDEVEFVPIRQVK